MKITRKWIFRVALILLLAATACVVWSIATIPRLLRDCYSQWVTAELIIECHRKTGRFPSDWGSLEPFYGDGAGLHHGGLNFLQISELITVEFGRLPELQPVNIGNSTAANLPRVIYTKSGRRSHWSGAEPNQMIHEYLREQQRQPANSPSPPRAATSDSRSKRDKTSSPLFSGSTDRRPNRSLQPTAPPCVVAFLGNSPAAGTAPVARGVRRTKDSTPRASHGSCLLPLPSSQPPLPGAADKLGRLGGYAS
jgi:hypothetical protein